MNDPKEWYIFKLDWLDQVNYAADVSATAKVVAHCIIQHCNVGDECGYPSLRLLAALTTCSKQTVITAVEQLSSKGYLELEPGSPGRGAAHCHLYKPGKRWDDETFAAMIQERKVKLKAIRRSPKGPATVPFKDETLRVTNSKKVQSPTEKVQPLDQNPYLTL
jgi:DNA-binding transcriptional MocR family regulator